MNSLDKMEDYDRLAAALAKEKSTSKELRRDVAMLRDALCYHQKLTRPIDKSMEALLHTQATAEAYEREVQIVTLEELKWKHPTDSSGCYIHSSSIDSAIAELRAANKGKEVV